MAAKQSAEMKKALALVAGGMPVRKAAEKSGVWFTSLYQAIAKAKQVEETTSKKKKKK